jgi:DNA-binding winged helix-turn-helix (wHTH) protein
MARLLLGEGSLPDALAAVDRRLAQALDLPSAAVKLESLDGDERQIAVPLDPGRGRTATLLLPAAIPPERLDRVLRRIAPSLEAGADDYVTKPFGPRELVARLRAVLRRSGATADEPVIAVDGLEIDLAAHAVRRNGSEVHLTPIEFGLLRALALNRGRLLTHRMLLAEVWGPRYVDDTRTLRTHIANLRRKIEPDADAPRLIRTDPGVGYRFGG